MRRIYHRFPHKIDLEFSIERPFTEVVRAIAEMNNTHISGKSGDDMMVVDFRVMVTDEKVNFVQVDELPGFMDALDEAVDFKFILNKTILTAEKKIPHSKNVFLLRVSEKGTKCDCFAAKEDGRSGMDALDFRNLIKGAIL